MDLFSSAAEAIAIPVSSWSRPADADEDWYPGWGPHPKYNGSFNQHVSEERVLVVEIDDRTKAWVNLGFDNFSSLWIFIEDYQTPQSASYSFPTYNNGAFPDRDSCLNAGRAKAQERLQAELQRIQESRARLRSYMSPAHQHMIDDDSEFEDNAELEDNE